MVIAGGWSDRFTWPTASHGREDWKPLCTVFYRPRKLDWTVAKSIQNKSV